MFNITTHRFSTRWDHTNRELLWSQRWTLAVVNNTSIRRITDSAPTVPSITFVDLDLDEDHIGGTFHWGAPSGIGISRVALYNLYLADWRFLEPTRRLFVERWSMCSQKSRTSLFVRKQCVCITRQSHALLCIRSEAYLPCRARSYHVHGTMLIHNYHWGTFPIDLISFSIIVSRPAVCSI